MRFFDRLQTGCVRLVPAATVLAALFVPLPPASADDCPPDGCTIPPPQSREVNPAPAHADASLAEIPKSGEPPPVAITVHVLAPAFVDPAPVGAWFEAISVPVRYQDPGDVSCGVQALGMAMDALPGAAPTSASLLGLLEADGMMYDFGTGVEELAYAAQSFAYKGSFAFHGASFEQVQTQLAAGSPVVVSLGSNGEGAPGHFVTVTGVSSDGQWVAYNDPTLGEQVISASEFERLWRLQGNSGVAVASDPPAAAGADPGVLSLWVAFAAGLMALVSTTPLAKLRQGIGGMLDAGGGGNYTPIRWAPKSSPPEKEREKEKDKEPKTSKSRFDDEIAGVTSPPQATTVRPKDDIALPSTPVSSVAVTPSELAAAQDPPPLTPIHSDARADEEDDREPKRSTTMGTTPDEEGVIDGVMTRAWTSSRETPHSASTIQPLFWDSDAVVNGSVLGKLEIGGPKFTLDGGYPGNRKVPLSKSPVAYAIQLIDTLGKTLLSFANANYNQSLEPNTDVRLYYGTYGSNEFRLPGMTIDNGSRDPIWVNEVVVSGQDDTTVLVPEESDIVADLAYLPPSVQPGESAIIHLPLEMQMPAVSSGIYIDVSVRLSAANIPYSLKARVWFNGDAYVTSP
jgi:hypothetical protein